MRPLRDREGDTEVRRRREVDLGEGLPGGRPEDVKMETAKPRSLAPGGAKFFLVERAAEALGGWVLMKARLSWLSHVMPRHLFEALIRCVGSLAGAAAARARSSGRQQKNKQSFQIHQKVLSPARTLCTRFDTSFGGCFEVKKRDRGSRRK